MDNILNVLDSKPIQFSGKSLFLLGIIGGILNLITRMEFLQASVIIISGILGIIFMVLKIQMIRLTIKEKKRQIAEEDMLQAKLKERMNESDSNDGQDS